jgi:hypothetical protein
MLIFENFWRSLEIPSRHSGRTNVSWKMPQIEGHFSLLFFLQPNHLEIQVWTINASSRFSLIDATMWFLLNGNDLQLNILKSYSALQVSRSSFSFRYLRGKSSFDYLMRESILNFRCNLFFGLTWCDWRPFMRKTEIHRSWLLFRLSLQRWRYNPLRKSCRDMNSNN